MSLACLVRNFWLWNKDERKALSVLTKDDTIVIVPADKGKSVVVLDKEDYNNKCTDLLKDRNTYKPVGYNPTHGFKEKVTKFTAKLFYDRTINADEKRKLDPPSEPTIPAFYGLPKIHKPEAIPVRPIVSSIDSPTYNLAKYAASVLGPLVGSTPHHIENTKDFVEKIKGFKLHEDGLLRLMTSRHYLPQFHLMSLFRLCETVWNQTKPSRSVLSSVWTTWLS